jgi:bile acid:Na+ symporter, BASS family
LVPIVTLILLRLFHASALVSVGFFILASCPGAAIGPPITAIARGDLPRAVGMMVILATLSALVTPVPLQLSVARLVPDGALHVDYLAISRTLVITQMLPLALGLGIHHAAPALTRRMATPVSRLANMLLLAVIALIVAAQHQMLAAIRLRAWVGMCLLFLASLAIGWLCGGTRAANRKAMAVTTTTPNAAVSLVIVNSSFANTPAVSAVVAYGLFSSLCALGFAFIVRSFGAVDAPTADRG